jgi:hypothetical protein
MPRCSCWILILWFVGAVEKASVREARIVSGATAKRSTPSRSESNGHRRLHKPTSNPGRPRSGRPGFGSAQWGRCVSVRLSASRSHLKSVPEAPQIPQIPRQTPLILLKSYLFRDLPYHTITYNQRATSYLSYQRLLTRQPSRGTVIGYLKTGKFKELLKF